MKLIMWLSRPHKFSIQQTPLYLKRKTGMLCMEDDSGDEFQISRDLLMKKNLEFDDITAGDACKRWPGLRYSSSYGMFLDKNAGVLRADRCLDAFQVNKWAKKKKDSSYCVQSISTSKNTI